MKLFRKLITVLLVSGLAASCNSVLDMPEDGRFSLEDIFKDFDLTMGYVNKCYSHMPGGEFVKDYAFEYGGSLLASFCDEAQDTRDVTASDVRSWYMGNSTASSFPMADFWGKYYEGIRTCNIFLSKIETAPYLEGDRILQSQTTAWKAQVHALRAFYFLQIIKRYGPAPIITEPVDEAAGYAGFKRSSFADCADVIISDCEAAIAYGLPWRIGNQMETDYGTVSRAFVYAVMSQAALYAASPLWNDAPDPAEKWRWAARITGNALNECLENDYQLFRETPDEAAMISSQSAYQTYFFTKMGIDRQRDKETIYECKVQMNVWRDSGMPIVVGAIRAGACPTQEMVDAYEMDNGRSPFVLDPDGCVVYDGIEPRINAGSGYDPDRPYDDRDPRLTASIYYNGALYNMEDKGSGVEIYEGGNSEVSQNDQRFTRTGYYLRKFHHNLSDSGNLADGYMKIFRLGELYLNFAEAANEAYGPGVAVDGVTGSVRTAQVAVNAVRTRAGMPNFQSGMSQADFRAKYRNERRVELAFEQHRFYDVRRWMILDKTDRVVTGMNAVLVDNGNIGDGEDDDEEEEEEEEEDEFIYKRFTVAERQAYQPQYLMLPLPVSEVSKMEKYTGTDWQNPGW